MLSTEHVRRRTCNPCFTQQTLHKHFVATQLSTSTTYLVQIFCCYPTRSTTYNYLNIILLPNSVNNILLLPNSVNNIITSNFTWNSQLTEHNLLIKGIPKTRQIGGFYSQLVASLNLTSTKSLKF